MRLFHVSSNHDIEEFKPRFLQRRPDMKEAYVWAVDIEKLYGFFFPEDCPRLLTFRGQEPNYVEKGYAIAYIKKDWEEVLKSTHLSIYELDDKNFDLFDKIAGYYVSKQTEVPIARYRIEDCIKALDVYDVDLRVADDLEPYRQGDYGKNQ